MVLEVREVPDKYIVRFVSQTSGAGKTHVASRVVEYLSRKGYLVGVVKHCASGVNLEDKDSEKYVYAGASTVLLSTTGLAVMYKRGHEDVLEAGLPYLIEPIIIVEGFKESKIGDAVIVARDINEFLRLRELVKGVIAVYLNNPDTRINLDLPIYRPGEEEKLAEFIEERALKHYISQLPGSNCQLCGFESCRKFLFSYFRGESTWCPVISDISLLIDGVEVPINPFVKSIFKNTIRGMIQSLKGVPSRPREIRIWIRE
jgi:molybdopterin-guanine dinucleotide biosynthesis protein B